MPARVHVLYPTTPPGAAFDLGYYLNKHMPMAESTWKSHGLKSWTVHKFSDKSVDGSPAPHSIETILEFESTEAIQLAMASEGAPAIMADIPTFSNREAIITISEVVGSS